ncbi:MAG: DUF1294 domain-containing protein [Pseudomonadota bacterium]
MQLFVAIAVAVVALASIVGGALFVFDKRAASQGHRRVPENVLLLFAAAGAAPIMVWLSGRIRHKTRKQPFRGILLAILFAQALAAFALIVAALGLL